MRSLRIEPNKYQLKIYCLECARPFTHNTIEKCSHPDRQKYKSIVYSEGNKVKTKFYETRDYDTALSQAILFKKDVKNHSEPRKIEYSPIISNYDELTILDSANLYMDYKNGINVPTHLKRTISKKHLESIEYNLRLFLTILRDNGVEPKQTSIADLNDFHVGMFADYLKSNFKEGSWNLRVSILKSFVEYTIKKNRLQIQNPFEGFRRVKFEKTIESITQSEFNTLLHSIENNNPFEKMNGKTKRKNRYRDYLMEAYSLALYTGLRREELLTLTWKDIVHSPTESNFIIITDNLKVERITGKKCQPKFVPVHAKLLELLNELGLSENMGSTKYIVQPNRTASLKTMMTDCTRGFSHFYREAFPDRPYKSMGVLRKTYLSYLYRETDENMIKLSSHGNMRTLETHYLDKRLIAKGANINMF